MSTHDKALKNQTDVANRLKRLIEAHQSLAELESLDELLPRLLTLARNVTDAEASSILLHDARRDVLVFKAVEDEVLGEKALDILKNAVELKMGEGVGGWVAQHRTSVIIEDSQNDPRFSSSADRQSGFVTRNHMCVPILYGDDLLGVINVLNAKTQPCFGPDDLELLECFADLAGVAITRSRFLEVRLRQQRMEVQLEIAAKIQSLFWPKLPDLGFGSHVWAVSQPAAFVGGDVYDVIPMPDNSWLIYVADVSDKSLPAALIMVALWSKIRSESLIHKDVARLLESVNTSMYNLLAEEGFFATILLARFWPEDGKIHMCRAGHLHPLCVSKNQTVKIPNIKGISLGVQADVEFGTKEWTLSPGDSLFLLTDGVTEAENESQELLGDRALDIYLRNAEGPPRGPVILNDINSYRGSAPPNDDLTIVEIWREQN